jgi:PncC family amidohydrolase
VATTQGETGDPPEAIVERIAARLIERGETISVCESSTGGLLSASLLAVPGASRFFMGGLVVYTATARGALLGITSADMAGIRSATEPYARLLAARCRERLGTAWSVAETGAAGPTGNRYGDPAGHACFAVTGDVQASRTIRTGQTEREGNMRAFAEGALLLLHECLGARTHEPAQPVGLNEGQTSGDEAQSGSVSLMITRRQRAQLLELGYTDDAVREMTPAEAHNHLGIARS